MERVADALCHAQLDSQSWEPEARAAIREVAHWIDAEARQRQLYPQNGVYSATEWLEQEAG